MVPVVCLSFRRPPPSPLFPYTTLFRSYDTDPVALDRSVAPCVKAAAAHDAQLTDERANLLNAWLAVLQVRPLVRSEEHTPELQSRQYLVCRLLLRTKQHAGGARKPGRA